MTEPNDRRSGRAVKDLSLRTATRRDRDRVLYSDPFRRLGGVTQVAVGAPLHQLHNRLTHSLKVEQVGLSIHSMLAKSATGNDFMDAVDLHAVAAACLGHDLGHPPFGHAAEIELDDILVCDEHQRDPRSMAKRLADPCTTCLLEDGFEGNAQSFRILAVLAVHRQAMDAPNGLDLTRASLQAVSKYPWTRNDAASAPKSNRKWGAYDCDAYILEWAFGTQSSAISPSAQVMDWADDISYAVHDIEDFFRTGHIPLESYSARHEEETSAELAHPLADFFDYVESAEVLGPVSTTVRRSFDGFRTFFPTTRFQGTPADLVQLDRLRSRLLDQFISRTKFEGGQVVRNKTLEEVNSILKQFIWFYIIDAPALDGIQQGQRKIIRDVFNDLRPKLEDAYQSGKAADPSPKELRRLPYALKRAVDLGRAQDPSPYTEHQKLMRALVDYISGLSDLEAYRLHETLKGRETAAEFR